MYHYEFCTVVLTVQKLPLALITSFFQDLIDHAFSSLQCCLHHHATFYASFSAKIY